MGLSDAFNHGFKTSRVNDSVLSVVLGTVQHEYDFLNRVVMTFYNSQLTLTPFAQMDRETLITMRDRLIELEGKPPELPVETPSVQATAKKFNL